MVMKLLFRAPSGLDLFCRRFQQWPVIENCLRIIVWVLLGPAYLGLLIAPAVTCCAVLALPRFWPVAFWIAFGCVAIGLIYFLTRGVKALFGRIQQGWFDVELFIGWLGLVLATAFLAAAILTGFFFRQ